MTGCRTPRPCAHFVFDESRSASARYGSCYDDDAVWEATGPVVGMPMPGALVGLAVTVTSGSQGMDVLQLAVAVLSP